ncbi:MAG: IS607 family transposase [Scytonema hyalinum WJT4-NPBG1]|nr:IS607 family transposase [Scytonema hyalinum WJT4-NPBG1]
MKQHPTLGCVSTHTRRWEKSGIIKAIRTPSGQRRYDITSYQGLQTTRRKRATITYARVSSRGTYADLDRQVSVLKSLYPDSELITDIASGLNFKRAGLRTLLGRLRTGDIGLVVVAHKDRLARFGFDLIQWLCEQDGAELLVLNQNNLSPERELVEDILAIVHVFSCRLYGLRSRSVAEGDKYKTAIKEDKDLPRT